jgi:hypothetical protein
MSHSFLFAVRLAALVVGLMIKPAAGQPGVIAAASDDDKHLASQILNPAVSGVEILEAELKGNAAQHGVYAQAGDFFKGLPSTGIVLSSGKVADLAFSPQIPNTGFDGSLGDSDLDSELKTIGPGHSSSTTADAAVLSIQFKVSKPVTIKVAYVFGSADSLYPDPDTFFPDIFGLFLNNKNVALIGGKVVSTATVYCGADKLNCDQLILNFNPINEKPLAGTRLPVYTKTQEVTLDLPIGTHKLKVAVADGYVTGDRNRYYDAAVFLSFVGAVQAPTAAPVSIPVPVPIPVPAPGKMKMTMMMMM